MPTTKPTQAELAARFGVSRKTVNQWKGQGVDVYNIDAVALHITSLQVRPEGLSQELIGIIEGMSGSDTLEDLKKEDIRQNIILKKIKIKVEEGKYLSIEEVQEAILRIATVSKAATMKLVNELPQALEGLPVGKIQKKLKTAAEMMLQEQADEMAKIIEGEVDE